MSVLPDPGASRAVLIGTSRYDHLEQLPAVSNNLTALAALLRGPLSLRMPATHVTVIENPPDPLRVGRRVSVQPRHLSVSGIGPVTWWLALTDGAHLVLT